MAVDPRVTVSGWTGSIVGKFLVGDGHKVGAPSFQPAKPRMTLKGQHVNINVVAMLKQVNPGKARMTLRKPANSALALIVSSTVKPSPTATTKLTLKGKPGLRLVTPGRQVTGKPRMTLKSKAYRVNRSVTMRPGIAKLTLRGGPLTKVGKAGLVPTVATPKILAPHASADQGNIVPTPAYTELLVPTVEEFV
jgi:hypothetical protein